MTSSSIDSSTSSQEQDTMSLEALSSRRKNFGATRQSKITKLGVEDLHENLLDECQNNLTIIVLSDKEKADQQTKTATVTDEIDDDEQDGFLESPELMRYSPIEFLMSASRKTSAVS